MNKKRKILLVLLLLFAAMQFFRPAINSSSAAQQADMSTSLNVPKNVSAIFQKSCYDCHSNNTRYPWYAHVQPLGWWLAMHIKDGKSELNFNEFGNYSRRKQLNKVKSIKNSINDGSMPLQSYTLLHTDAKISEELKALVIEWATKTADSLSTLRR